MTPSSSASDGEPGRELRRAARVRPGPLRVPFHRTCEGVLVDVSETGALVRVPSAQAAEKHLTLSLEAHGGLLQLRARVVRSSPHRVQLPAATILRTEYHVAVEFSDLGGEQLVALRQLLEQP